MKFYNAYINQYLKLFNKAMDDVKRWQQRPLDALYPIVYLDCIVVKSQDGGAVANKSVYLALGVNGQGEK